jgi:hypothetical protein
MHARLQTVNREKVRQIRSSTVEPVLGTLVNYLAMRRVNTRGISQANKCMLMSAIAYNLKKLIRWQQRKVETAVVSLKKTGKSLCIWIFNLRHFLQHHNCRSAKFIFK